jgi:hypothetical protein
MRHGKNRCATPAGLRKEHLNVSDITLGEASLAITEVIFPHPYELFIVPEGAYLIQMRLELLAPGDQCFLIMRCDVFVVHQSEI